MANYKLDPKEIVNHISLINYFDGTLEKLDPFFSAIDHLLKHSPDSTHEYILGAIINTKLDARVRSCLPINITTWPQLKTNLLVEFKSALNYSKFHMDLIRAKVRDYDSLEEFIDNMQKTYYRYKMARQYSNIDTPIDHKNLIENLVEQVAKFTQDFVITLAAKETSYLNAIAIIQSKSKCTKSVSFEKPKNSDELKDFFTEIRTAIADLKNDSNRTETRNFRRNNFNGSRPTNESFVQNPNFNRNYNQNSNWNNSNQTQYSNQNSSYNQSPNWNNSDQSQYSNRNSHNNQNFNWNQNQNFNRNSYQNTDCNQNSNYGQNRNSNQHSNFNQNRNCPNGTVNSNWNSNNSHRNQNPNSNQKPDTNQNHNPHQNRNYNQNRDSYQNFNNSSNRNENTSQNRGGPRVNFMQTTPQCQETFYDQNYQFNPQQYDNNSHFTEGH
jgi:hypothetical protein